MNDHPADAYGERRRPAPPPQNIEQFPSVARRPVVDAQPAQQQPAPILPAPEVTESPSERANRMLNQIAIDLLWIPYDAMMEFAKELLGKDSKAPGTANEMADVVNRWAKGRADKL